MRAAVYHAAGDVRVETVPDASIQDPTDAVVRVTRATVCGSDLWSYRGVTTWQSGWRYGHEFVGVVEEVGAEVRSVRPGDAVIVPFVFSDGTCEFCRSGLQTSCVHGGGFGTTNDGGQAEAARVPWADGTLVPMAPALAADPARLGAAALLTDVLPTGHHAARLAGVRAGTTAVVIGDGAVGLCAVLAAHRLGVERLVAVGHHADRLEIARRFGATDVVNSHADDAIEQVRELTDGGAPSVLEAVGMQSSLDFAIAVARPGGTIGYVGVPHTVGALNLKSLFMDNIGLHGGVAPARAYIEELMADVAAGTIDPTPVLDLTVDLEHVSEGFAAMHDRRAIKALVTVG